MCDPISIMAAASVGTGLLGVKSANDTKKARKRAAADAKMKADAAKSKQDLETRESRQSDYATRTRTDVASRPKAPSFGLFSPRSFFSGN